MNGLLAMAQAATATVGYDRVVEQLRLVAEDPTANPRLYGVAIAIVAVTFALLIVLLLLVATPPARRVRRRSTPAGRSDDGALARESSGGRRGRIGRLLSSSAAMWAVVAVSLASAYGVTSTDDYCAKTCHSGTAAASMGLHEAHAPCRSCHEAPLVVGMPANVAARLRMAVRHFRGTDPASAVAVVNSSACLGCHAAVIRSTVVADSGIAVAHRHPFSEGVPCTKCHARCGHVASTASAGMSDCVTCHDAKTASNDCDVCHRADPVVSAFAVESKGKVVGTGKRVFPAVRAARRECGLCHDEEAECDECHGGTRMPHSGAFIRGGHAVAAAFERKLGCWRCHDPVDCGKCHGSFNPASGTSTHGPGWKSEHGEASWDSGCVCHSGRSTRKAPICTRCHLPDHSLRTVRR